MKYVDPPFDLGETLSGTDDDSNLINTHWQGAIFEFPDVDRTPALRGGKGRRSGRTLTCVCVRNTSGSALTTPAGKLYRFDLGQTGRLVVGSIDDVLVADKWGGCVDPELVGDVASNDFCWLVIKGVVTVTDSGSGLSAGDCICGAAAGDVAVLGAANLEPLGHVLDAISANQTGLAALNVRY